MINCRVCRRRGRRATSTVAETRSSRRGWFRWDAVGIAPGQYHQSRGAGGRHDANRAPYFVGPDSAYYLANNRNKSSIVINLKTAEGCRLLERLAGEVDIVIENYRPGVLKRLGLAVPELLIRHPALIWASISGFGQDGPWCDRPAYDLIVQALSGAMSLTGEPDGQPVRLGIPVGDLVAGLYAVIGLLAAWADRLSQ